MVIFLSLVICHFSFSPARAQVGDYRTDFALGVNGGYMMSNVGFMPEVPQGWLGGLTGGLTMRYTCEKYFNSICAIVAEVNLAQTGWKEDIIDTDRQPVYYADDPDKLNPLFYERKMNYVQVPLMVRYEEMYSGCTFALGFAWGRLVRAKEIYNGFTRTTSVRSKTFKTSDWSFIADVNIRLYKNLSLDLRYEYSLVPILTMEFTYVYTDGSTVSETYKLHNHMISTRLVYYFNEKFYKNTRVNNNGQIMGTKWLREIPEYND